MTPPSHPDNHRGNCEHGVVVAAVEGDGAAAPPDRIAPDPSGDSEPGLMRLVALLLFLLLAVNLGILVTLLRQSRATRALVR